MSQPIAKAARVPPSFQDTKAGVTDFFHSASGLSWKSCEPFILVPVTEGGQLQVDASPSIKKGQRILSHATDEDTEVQSV